MDHTILILTCNRDYLKGVLNYYNKYNRCNILIADSSTPEIKERNEQLIKEIKNCKIEYLKYDCGISFTEKIYKASLEVKTKYSVICADDDFLLPSGINKPISFLEENPIYSCAHGIYLRFNKTLNNIKYIYKNIERESDDQVNRCLLHLTLYNPTQYAVHRSDDLRYIYEMSSKYKHYDGFAEILPSLLITLKGNIKKFNTFAYYIKRKNFGASALLNNPSKFDVEYYNHYNEFKNILYNCINKEINNDFEKKLDRAFRIFLKDRNPLIKDIDNECILSKEDKDEIKKIGEFI
jgi:glycosyltransferase domain-containing protein